MFIFFISASHTANKQPPVRREKFPEQSSCRQLHIPLLLLLLLTFELTFDQVGLTFELLTDLVRVEMN